LRSVQDISHQLIQANYIFDNLLNWAKAELNSKYGKDITAHPFLAAEEIMRQLKSTAEKKKIKIVNRIEESISLAIPADILKIVFRNLISNAIKFSHENSEVILKYEKERNILQVADFGVGIEDETVKQLFNQNVFPSLGTWKETGFGLGLYMVYELLHRFHGNISIQKNIPTGTIFNISVPVAE
jgi:two-component system, sensor histidine kinase and response regulator